MIQLWLQYTYEIWKWIMKSSRVLGTMNKEYWLCSKAEEQGVLQYLSNQVNRQTFSIIFTINKLSGGKISKQEKRRWGEDVFPRRWYLSKGLNSVWAWNTLSGQKAQQRQSQEFRVCSAWKCIPNEAWTTASEKTRRVDRAEAQRSGKAGYLPIWQSTPVGTDAHFSWKNLTYLCP